MKFLALTTLLMVMFTITAFSEPAPYTNECDVDKFSYYCKYLGKGAYYKDDKKKLIIGKIIAVTWKDKGDILDLNPTGTAVSDGYYYVIDTGDPKLGQFLVDVDLVKVVK